jgi:hypothetical protein
MQRITIDQYIADRLDGQYEYYSKAAGKAKKQYQTIKVVEIVLAAMVPFLSAMMTPSSSDYMKIIVGVLGVGITILSGTLLLYKFSETWVNYRSTAQALKSEKFLFLTRTGAYKGRNATALFIEKIELILGEESQKWQSYVISKEDDAAGGDAPVANNPVAEEPVAEAPTLNSAADAPTEEPPVTEEPPADEPAQ